MDAYLGTYLNKKHANWPWYRTVIGFKFDLERDGAGEFLLSDGSTSQQVGQYTAAEALLYLRRASLGHASNPYLNPLPYFSDSVWRVRLWLAGKLLGL
jgi:hypothetical protein